MKEEILDSYTNCFYSPNNFNLLPPSSLQEKEGCLYYVYHGSFGIKKSILLRSSSELELIKSCWGQTRKI